IEAANARLIDSWHVRQDRRSFEACHRQGLRLAGMGHLEHLRPARHVDMDVAAEEIVERRRAASIRDMNEFYASRKRDQLGRNLIDAARTGCRVGAVTR